MLQLKKTDIYEQNWVWLFYYFDFDRNHDVLKSKSPCILLNKNIKLNKNEMGSKMENSTDSFREMNLVLQLIQKSQIKSKTVVSLSSRKKKEGIFVPFSLFGKNFSDICVLSLCIVYWIQFQNINTFTYQKKYYFIHFCCLFLKSSKAFSVSL